MRWIYPKTTNEKDFWLFSKTCSVLLFLFSFSCSISQFVERQSIDVCHKESISLEMRFLKSNSNFVHYVLFFPFDVLFSIILFRCRRNFMAFRARGEIVWVRKGISVGIRFVMRDVYIMHRVVTKKKKIYLKLMGDF